MACSYTDECINVNRGMGSPSQNDPCHLQQVAAVRASLAIVTNGIPLTQF